MIKMEMNENQMKDWLYILPDGSEVNTMRTAKIKLGVSKTRLIGMLKSGVVKRIEILSTKSLYGYEATTTINN